MKLAETTPKTAKFRRYFYNSSWMIAEQVLRIVSGIFVGIYIARYLGPERYGAMTYALSILSFSLAIGKLGLDATLTRELIKANPNSLKAKALIGTAFWLTNAAALFLYLVTAAILSTTNEPTETKTLILISCTASFFTSFLCIDYFFQSQLQSKYAAICKSTALAIGSVIKIILIASKADISLFIVASVADHIILSALLAIAFLAKRDMSYILIFSKKSAIVMLKSSWPIIITATATMLMMRTDQIMIRGMLGLHDLGIYSAAVKVYESWIIIPYVVTISLLPAIVKLKQGHKEIYHQKLCIIFRCLTFLSAAVALFVFLLSSKIMTLTFGQEYESAATSLSIVMWTAVLASMSSVSARYLNAEKMEKKIAIRTIASSLLNIALNLILIPAYGIEGAAFSTLICMFINAYAIDFFDKDLRQLLKIKNSALFFTPLPHKN